MKTNFQIRICISLVLCISLAALSAVVIAAPIQDNEPPTDAGQAIEIISPYFAITRDTLATGEEIVGARINGPSEPLPGFEGEGLVSERTINERGTIADFPSYDWVFGCSAVSSAMLAGYYDINGFVNMYTGPTNDGVMPLTDTYWSTWHDDAYDYYPNNPLVASHNGVDGRLSFGSIDDFWVEYGSSANDPYIAGEWAQHAWGSAVGDYMKTSQSAYENVDGSTWFYNYNSNSKLTCSAMESIYYSPLGRFADEFDGTYGRKLFYEARGYTVGDCYNQQTDNQYSGGFSLADFQAEIDAGHPVLLNVTGHSMVGYGYDGSTIYIRNTWDSDPENTYSMPWGGSYQDMTLYAVSVVHPELATPPTAPNSVSASDGAFTDKVTVTWVANPGATSYSVFRNSSNTHSGEEELISDFEGAIYNDTGTDADEVNYYWVKACNDNGCSDYSSPDTGFRSAAPTVYNSFLPLIVGGEGSGGNPLLNGDFEQGQVAWDEDSTHGWDIVITDTFTPEGVSAHSGEWLAWLGGDFDDTSYVSQTITISPVAPYLHYWYWVASEDICGWDYFRLKVDSSSPVILDLCDTNDTGGWVEGIVDLSGFTGSSRELKFEVTADDYLNSNFFLDDVSFSGSASASGAVFLPDGIELLAITRTRWE